MTSSFKVTLDTTAPALSVKAKRDPGDSTLLFLELDFDDAQELQVWGDIDILDVGNANYGEDASAPWFTAESPLTVRLAPIATPTLHISARDDVWNVRTLVRSFPNTVEPPVEPAHSSGGLGAPPARPSPEFRSLVRRSKLVVGARHSLLTRRRAQRGATLRPRRTLVTHEPGGRRVVHSAPLRLRRRGEVHSLYGGTTALTVTSRRTIRKRGDDEDTAAIIALNLLM